MNKYAKKIKDNLENSIKEITINPKTYALNPEKDFTRTRKLPLDEMIRIILTIGGNSLNLEIMKYFSYDLNAPTTSAFVQQRGKILLGAFKEIFENFTNSSLVPKTHKGYRLLAVDGSSFCISHNPNDKKTYISKRENSKGSNHLHLNAVYDLCNRVYVDAIIQNGREIDERQALIDVIQNKKDKNVKSIYIADRGYESYNLFEHMNQNGQKYVIRVKDINSKSISSSLNIQSKEIIDKNINLLMTRRQTNEIKLNKKKYRFLAKSSKFDFLPTSSKNTYPLSFRIVRFPISETRNEVLITNLSEDEFSVEELKELYRLRWGIETSFRELKYSIGLINLHSKKVEYIKQEIYAKLTMYNFCEIITTNVIIKKKNTKHTYQVNFTAAITVCLLYFKKKFDIPHFDVEALILRNILPVRTGRKDPRKTKTRSLGSFFYRVS